MNKILIGFLLILFFISQAVFGQTTFQKSAHVVGDDTLKYQILFPDNFNPKKQYPLVLFLHGVGERGSDNEKQLVHGGRLFLDAANRKSFPAVVIFPQCRKESYWANAEFLKVDGKNRIVFDSSKEPTTAMALLISMVDSVVALTFIQKNQRYVGGLSMGGMGTFDLLSRRSETFAAAFAICGGGSPDHAAKYAKTVPMWIFHGAKDDIVLPEYSQEMVTAIKANGGNPKFTLYPDANHNSWDSTFAEPELLPWLFSNKKSKKK